jgi:hypothetical protein
MRANLHREHEASECASTSSRLPDQEGHRLEYDLHLRDGSGDRLDIEVDIRGVAEMEFVRSKQIQGRDSPRLCRWKDSYRRCHTPSSEPCSHARCGQIPA